MLIVITKSRSKVIGSVIFVPHKNCKVSRFRHLSKWPYACMVIKIIGNGEKLGPHKFESLILAMFYKQLCIRISYVMLYTKIIVMQWAWSRNMCSIVESSMVAVIVQQ